MGDLFKVTAPSGLKLRSAPSTDGAVIIFAMIQGTVVEAIGASLPDDPHFTPVRVALDQPVIMQEGEAATTPASQGYAYEEGFASADWLVPIGAQMPDVSDPGPLTPVSSPPVVTSSAATGTGGVMLLLLAVVAAALYAAK